MSQELYGHPIHAFWARLFGGAVGPIILVALAVRWLVAGSVSVPSRYGFYEIEGMGAAALAVAAIGAAAYMHLRWLWRPIAHNYWQVIDIGMMMAKLAAGVGLIVCLGLVVLGMFR